MSLGLKLGRHSTPEQFYARARRSVLLTWFAYPVYRLGERLASLIPAGAVPHAARLAGSVAWAVMPRRRRLVASTLERVLGALPGSERRRRCRNAFVSAATYWLDTFRLWSIDPADAVPDVDPEGMELLTEALRHGKGVLLVTPHFGSWDKGGAWLTSLGFPVTAVMERLEPPRLRDWFVEVRRRIGIRVIVRGPDVWERLGAALAANEIVVLVADRDLRGRGIPVEFFGGRTTLPKGPAELSRRCEAPVIAVAFYDAVDGVHRAVGYPVVAPGDASSQLDSAEVTRALAVAFERLIAQAPEQWHLFQPLWTSEQRRA